MNRSNVKERIVNAIFQLFTNLQHFLHSAAPMLNPDLKIERQVFHSADGSQQPAVTGTHIRKSME